MQLNSLYEGRNESILGLQEEGKLIQAVQVIQKNGDENIKYFKKAANAT